MTLPPPPAGAPVQAPLRRVLALVCSAALVAAVAGCTSAGATDGARTAPPAPANLATVGPAPLVPSVSPGPRRVPAPQLDPVPAPGTVRLEQGAFPDRLDVSGLSLLGGTRVVGRVANTADVSELIVLELQADFYDATGRLLGSGTAAYAAEEFADTGATVVEVGPDDAFAVEVTSRPAVVGAVSAVVTVPQLVNE